MITVCVPVLRRYDMLRVLIQSLGRSNVPVQACVINNGLDKSRLAVALKDRTIPVEVHQPTQPLGVAESWNWFGINVPEERVIANDDVEFLPDSLERLVAPRDYDLIWAASNSHSEGFSCFVWRDSCIEKLGLFDESISPGYGYYEDEDYLQRLDGRGTREPSAKAGCIECGIRHDRSSTLRAASHQETLEHHRRFLIAQGNYARKWGVTF